MLAPRQSQENEWLRIVRFGLVGIANTLLFGLAAHLAAKGGLAPLPATAVGYAASFAVSYTGHQNFSFAVTPDHRTHLWRFAIVTGTTFAASLALTWAITGPIHRPYGLAVIVVMIAIPPISYVLNRFWVFLPGMDTHRPPSG